MSSKEKIPLEKNSEDLLNKECAMEFEYEVDKVLKPPQFYWMEIREERSLPMITRRELENTTKSRESSELLPPTSEDIRLLEKLLPEHDFSDTERINNIDAFMNYEIFKKSLQNQRHPHERQSIDFGNPSLSINKRINEVYLWISTHADDSLQEIAEVTGIYPRHKGKTDTLGEAYYFLIEPPCQESDNILCKVILGTPCFDPHLCNQEGEILKSPFSSKFFQKNNFLVNSAITTSPEHYIAVDFADQILPILLVRTKRKNTK
jgi:hypothetical protein